MGAVLDMQCTRENWKNVPTVSWNGQGWYGAEFVGQSIRRGGILMRKGSRNLHRSPLEVLFSWIPNGCVEGKPLLRLGRKKKKTNFWGKNNYYGVVSKTVPTAHPWLRNNHIPTNQIEKSSLNTQNIQKRPDYSDSSETMQVRRQWKNL